MRLRNPGAVESALATLDDQRLQLGNVLSTSHGWRDLKLSYLRWAETANAQYRNIFSDGGLADGLYNETYWQIHQINTLTDNPYDMVYREIDRQAELLDTAAVRLRDLRKFIAHLGQIVVPDSSALLRGEVFWDFDWSKHFGGPVRIIVPILVVEELDGVKDRERNSTAGDRARKVLRKLREVCRAVEPGTPAVVRKGATIEVFLDDHWHLRRPNKDAEIIDQALAVESLTGKGVILTCVDASMEFRARQFGLDVREMPTPADMRDKGNGSPSGH